MGDNGKAERMRRKLQRRSPFGGKYKLDQSRDQEGQQALMANMVPDGSGTQVYRYAQRRSVHGGSSVPGTLGDLLLLPRICPMPAKTCLLCYFFGLGHGGMVRASITHADQHRQGRGGVGAQWTEKVPHFLLHLSYQTCPLCPNLHMCGSVKLHKLLVNQVRYSVPKRSTGNSLRPS